MIRKHLALLMALCLGHSVLLAQTPAPAAKPAAPKPASAAPAAKTAAKTAAKPAATASPVGKIIQMIEMKLPDPVVLKAIETGGPISPTADDYIKLKKLGASDAIISALASGATAAPAAAASSAPAVSSSTPAASASSAMPVSAGALSTINTDFSTLACTKTTSSAKRVVAIDEFDFGTVQSSIAAIFGTQVDVGKGILALLTKRLAEEGKYRIVERKNIQKVLTEQDFGASNRVKQGTQAKIGRVQGADAILMGTITVFGQDTRKNGVSTSALGIPTPRIFGGVNVGSRTDKAIVEISYRLIDAESSEVIAVGEARGESKRKGNSVGVAGFYGGRGGAGQVDMSSSNFQETVIGEATVDCVTKLAAIANQSESKIARRAVDVEAKIADISGNKVYLAAGANEGVSQCDRFEISRIIKEIKDPSTGEVLDLQTEKVGELMVMEVRDKISIAYFNGTAMPKVGYVAKKM
jgi:curli biogenesis system outer membrane secretion channel CsgG